MGSKRFRPGTIAVLAALFLSISLLTGCAAPGPAAPPSTPAAETKPTLPPSAYAPWDFQEENGYLTCLGAQTALGIDVSHHQQQIDWAQVKAAGIEFVMVRLGYRGLEDGGLNPDRYAAENLAGARAAGLRVGAYFYSQATTAQEALEEADYALALLGDFRLDLPLAFDWEIEARTEAVDIQTATDCALAFCGAVEAAGYDAMIYFNSYQARERLELSRLTAYPWWLAMYDHSADFPCRFDVWQYTSTGAVPGIAGNVDINVMLVDDRDY